MSLRTKIFTRTAALIAVVVVFSSVLYCVSATYHHRMATLDQFKMTVISRASDVDRQITREDNAELQRIVEALVGESTEGVVAYAFVERYGESVVHTFEKEVPRAVLDHPTSPAGTSVWRFRDSAGTVLFDVAAHAPESGAVLHVGLSKRAIDRALTPLRVRTALLALAAILVGCFLSILFARWTTGEVERLAVALQREKGFSERLIASSVDGILAFDRKCRYTVWNPGMERMTGVPAADTLGKVAFEVFPSLVETGDDRFFRDALAGQTVVAESRPYTIPASGRTGILEGHYSPLTDKAGKVVGGLALIRDVTERQHAEDVLKRSEEHFRSVIEHALDMILIIDAEARICYASPSIERLMGYAGADLIGRSAFEYVHPDDRARAEEIIAQMIGAPKKPATTELRIRRSDETWRTVEANGSNLLNSPAVRGIVLNCRDVTDRRQADQALRESLQITADIVQAIPSGLFVYQYEPPDRLILMEGNPQSARITGLKVEDCVGKEFNEIWPRARETGLTDDFLNVVKTGESYQSADLWYEDTKLGGAFRIYAFRMPGNRLGVAFEDVTEQRLAKDELAAKIKEIEDFNRLAVGRELKMIELKEEINALLKDQGRLAKYNIPT